MSDKIKKALENIDRYISPKLNDMRKEQDLLVALEKLLKTEIELSSLSHSRFEFYKKELSAHVQENILVESFIHIERRFCLQIYTYHKDSKSLVSLQLKKRSNDYLKIITAFNPSNLISNTFNWFGNNPNDNRKEIIRLYEGLRGLNSKKLFFISSQVSRNDFIALMTGGTISEPVKWLKATNLFIYLIDEIASTYLTLPKNIEDKFTEDPTKRKSLMDWLNPKIEACFKDKNSEKIEANKLSSLRNKINLKSLRDKEIIDEIISNIRVD